MRGANTILPDDLKFYSFYGSIPLMFENRKDSKIRKCYWDENKNIVDFGRKDIEMFIGDGIDDFILNHVKAISLEIPAPFVRIDLLKGVNGYFLGEFSPYPGDMRKFNKYFDTLLGHEFLKAETRLIYDIMNGKQFESYNNIRNQL